MKKKILSFFGILAVLFVSQSAWAAAGDKTTDSQTWSAGQLEATIQSGKSVMTTSNNFVKFTLTGDEAISFTSAVDISWGGNADRLLVFDECKANKQHNLAFTWEKVMTGYSLNVTTIRTLSAMAGSFGYYKLGSADEVAIAKAAGATSACTSPVSAGATSLPLYFRRGTLGTSSFMGVPHHGYITKISYEYQIIPDAPVWSQASDVMDVTVDNVNGQHLYNLASKLQVSNPAFAGTVKYEITSNNAKYVFWNSDHNAFYVLKPGTYTVKAYIEKVDGQYCSSVYSEEFTLTASVKEEEKENAKIYFFMDGMLAEEKDPINHVWEITMPMDTARHYIEYVSVDPTAMSFERSEKNITYLTDTDPLSDHFKMKTTLGDDSIKVSQGNKRAWLWINITGAGSNHLPYTVGEAEFNNGSIVITTDRVRWDAAHSDIEFEGDVTPIIKARTIEFAFTGVPDSVKFTYNTNAELNRNNVRLKLSYAAEPGQWVEVAQVAAPSSSAAAFDAKCAYAIPANAKYVQLQYYNAENSGWVRNFTITEKKAITFPQDTLVITGTHTPDGVATKSTSLSWYNVLDSLSWSVSGLGQNDKFSVNSSKIATQLDTYKENIPYEVKYKLDEPGVHYSNIMFWSQDKDASSGEFSVIAYYTVKGITAYGEKEIVVDNNLPEDTVSATPGQVIPSPFVVKDTAGNELPAELKDSIKYDYTITPAEAATIDENGNITPNCVGVIRIIAELQPNSLVPAAKDTVYLDVPEASKNVINWNLPTEFAKGDTLPEDLASTEDGAEMTYEFIPATAVQAVTGGYEVLQVGAFQIVAKAAQTCAHFAINDTVDVYAKGLVASIELNETINPANLNVLDTIANMFVAKGESGDTLAAPEANITYTIEPANMHVDENGNFVVDHSGDVKVTVTVAGDTLKTATKEFNFTLNPIAEQIFCNIPDTLILGEIYNLKNDLTSTLSQLGIDTVYVPESYENFFTIDGCVIETLKKGSVRIIMIAKGNDDFIGPVKYTKEVTIVGGVKDINWEEELKEELENAQLGDTIKTSDVKVYDEEGHEITDVEKTYEIIPQGAAHVTPEGDIVLDEAVDPITIIVTSEKEGMETKKDTLVFPVDLASVGKVELPEDILDGDVHVGDTISLKEVKVYDQNGQDITDQMDKIEYIIEPEEAAHFEKVGKDSVLVIDKDMPFDIITKITDPLIDPELATDTTKVEVETYNVGEVVLPEDVQIGELQPGETIDTDDIRVLDKDGKDITDLCNKEYTFIPEDAAHLDENGQIVIDKAGEITITTTITGEGIEPIVVPQTIQVDKFVPEDEGSFELPEPEHENGYQIGDELPITLKDKDGKDITDYADINVTIVPADKAHFDAEKGVIVLDQEGPTDFTITVGGDNVEPYSYNESIYIHHDEAGCYDLMVQLWNDVAIINNNNETATFVNYEWYKNGQLVAGQNGQDYHEANGAAMNGVYYAYAYDAAGNKYMICEKEFNGTAVKTSARMLNVYPTMVNTSNLYTIETEQSGEVFISTSNGNAAQRFTVEAGKNNVHAPFAQGVYMLRFVANDGQSAMQKLIVK